MAPKPPAKPGARRKPAAKKPAGKKPSPKRKSAPPKKRATASARSSKGKRPAAKRAPANKRAPASKPPRRGSLKAAAFRSVLALGVGLAAGGFAASFSLYQQARADVRAYLSTPPTTTPSTVWSAPMQLREGQWLRRADLVEDLLRAGFARGTPPLKPKQFREEGSTLQLHVPPVSGATSSAVQATLTFDGDALADITSGASLSLPPTLLATLGDLEARRTPVTLDTISEWMVPALLAIEDSRFHDHVGVDPIGIARALVHNLRGGELHGGSTLTQQLAKNLFLGQQRTLRRKVKEVFYAAALEAELDKDELLVRYLSEVYLGHVGGMPLYGVEQAARAWFGISATQLSAAQAATIAGVIASPNAYSPLRNPEKALQRRDQVIDRMVYVRAIGEAEAAAARKETLATRGAIPSASWRLPWAVAAALESATANVPEFSPSGGFALYTTIQPSAQRAAVSAVHDALAQGAERHSKLTDAEAAVVAIDARTGAVVAIVGGRDYRTSSFHRAIEAWRQAGSTVKPLTLLAALEEDPALQLNTLLADEPLTLRIDGRSWSPKNYDGTYLGEVSVREAIQQSRNIPAIHLSQRLGLQDQAKAFETLGLSRTTSLPSAALGAFPVTPLELAAAYGVFPGGGVVHAPYVLDHVDTRDGDRHWSPTPTQTRLASQASTGLAQAALEGVVQAGTGRSLARMTSTSGLGGKTGTTDGGRDTWFAGYVGPWAVVTWVGLDRGDLGLTGSQAALPVWGTFIHRVHVPAQAFQGVSGLEKVSLCANGLPACDACPEPFEEWFRTGYAPEKRCGLFTPPAIRRGERGAPTTPPPPPNEVPATEVSTSKKRKKEKKKRR